MSAYMDRTNPNIVPRRPREDGTGRQSCCHCHRRSVAGLRRGKGLCPYHWANLLWGQAWADRIYLPESIPGTSTGTSVRTRARGAQ